MLRYPVTIEPDGETVLVTCPVLPELTTFGKTREEALHNAELALEEAIAARISEWSDVPLPPTEAGQGTAVALSLQTTLKTLLFLACRREGVTRAELARRLGWHREQADRLFRLEHASRIDQLEAAFAALGKGLTVALSDAA